jgi:hypothetical protein
MKAVLRALGVSLLWAVTGWRRRLARHGNQHHRARQRGERFHGAAAFRSGGAADGDRASVRRARSRGRGVRSRNAGDIRISIEGTTLSTQTDAVGQFVVRGNFAGPATMVFDLPGGGQASLIVVVPRGGELTLSNVRIDARTGKATADSQRVRFGDSWTARTVRETRPRW